MACDRTAHQPAHACHATACCSMDVCRPRSAAAGMCSPRTGTCSQKGSAYRLMRGLRHQRRRGVCQLHGAQKALDQLLLLHTPAGCCRIRVHAIRRHLCGRRGRGRGGCCCAGRGAGTTALCGAGTRCARQARWQARTCCDPQAGRAKGGHAGRFAATSAIQLARLQGAGSPGVGAAGIALHAARARDACSPAARATLTAGRYCLTCWASRRPSCALRPCQGAPVKRWSDTPLSVGSVVTGRHDDG